MGKIRSEKRKQAIELRITLNLSTTEIANKLNVTFPVAKRYIAGYEQTEEQKKQNVKQGIDRYYGARINKGKSIENIRASRRKHYQNHKQWYYDRNAAKKKAIVARRRGIVDALKNNPCTDCGDCFLPCAMDFDHVRGKKIASISMICISIKYSDQDLFDEIKKCELVCACCHRIRTHKRREQCAPVAQQDSVSVSETEGTGSSPVGSTTIQ